MTNRVEVELDAKDELTPAVKAIAASAGFATLKAGIGDIGNKLAGMAKAAEEDERSTARLRQAVENSGASYDAYEKQLGDVIAKGQKLGITDDETRQSLALLTAQTGSAEEAQKRYALAQDLAAGAGIDVVTASRLLGKVTDENVSVLNRYGIAAKEGMDSTALFGMIQEKFGGQAAATASKVKAAQIAYDEMQETLGAKVLPIQTKVLELFIKLPEPIGLAGAALVNFGPAVAQTSIGLLAMAPAIGSVAKMLPAMGAAAVAAAPPLLALTVAVGAAYAASKLFAGSGPEWIKVYQGLQDNTTKLAFLKDKLTTAHGFEREAIEKEIRKLEEAIKISDLAADANTKYGNSAGVAAGQVAGATAAVEKYNVALQNQLGLIGQQNIQAADLAGLAGASQAAATHETELEQVRAGTYSPMGPNGRTFDEITGKQYLSPEEREFYLRNLPGRAFGGDVMAGEPYKVGERGTELFIPEQSGSVVPNGGWGSDVHLHFHGPVIGDDGKRYIEEIVRNALLRGGFRTLATT